MAEILTLEDYLSAKIEYPFEWGRSDCCTFAADWVHAVTGFDPAECVRGLYSSEVGAHYLIAKRGSLAEMVCEEMHRLGFKRTFDPISGDVGIVDAPVVGATAAIRHGGRWLMRRAHGIVGVQAPAIVAWEIHA